LLRETWKCGLGSSHEILYTVYSVPECYGAASQSLDLLPEAAAGGQEVLTSHQQQQKHSCPPSIHLLEVGGRQGRPEGPHTFLGRLMAFIADFFQKINRALLY
jgi:hypothetical protein